ncbi:MULTISPECIES: nuclease-related domain-containing protein [Clostridium]|uniref:NERD domain-containing protein n=1 Tax=Clostridium cibarium TaxID=2762247 RepID=A0ABR8PXE7_9CLOT|nr:MULTISPECIES: nuclease-related domain-containing protein [Clostridium]MBD7912853.1 NERD domain-containing protein [Clostridium cibarium]
MILFLLLILLIVIYAIIQIEIYNSSNYKKESKKNYFEVRFNAGNYGEYLSFNKLENIKGCKKILTNVYLPKQNGETTEIDLVFIHETGIYAIESKNYSSWIFGNEKSRYWTQTFPNGRKEKFYNPIMQNNTHIKNLAKVLNIDESSIKSVIVFSERCTLKKITVESQRVKVVNRNNLTRAINGLSSISKERYGEDKINKIYLKLKPYTCVSDDVKKKHINNIRVKNKR